MDSTAEIFIRNIAQEISVRRCVFFLGAGLCKVDHFERTRFQVFHVNLSSVGFTFAYTRYSD